jgi:signal transduction histidine kinase
MSHRSHQSAERLKQIGSIASAEQLGSILYFAHTGLFLLGCLILSAFQDAWWIAAFSMVYVIMFTAEKFLARWAFVTRSESFYPFVLAVLCMRYITYNAMVVSLWSMGGDLFQFGALAMLVSAAINNMVFHATYFPIILCTVMPLWGAFSGITVLFVWDMAFSVASALAVMITLCVTPYLLLAVYSVHERNTLYEKARRTLDQSHKQELLGRLVAGVAHDFANILSVSQANAEMIQDNQPSEKTKRYADEIMRACERGATLVEQLLSFGSRPVPMAESHEISDILNDFRLITGRVFPKSILVTTEIVDDTSTVRVDRNQLDVALLNLALNARDAMPAGGWLDLRVDSILVSDTDDEFRSMQPACAVHRPGCRIFPRHGRGGATGFHGSGLHRR